MRGGRRKKTAAKKLVARSNRAVGNKIDEPIRGHDLPLEGLRKLQDAFLGKAQAELDHRGKFLNTESCWAYLFDHLTEAKRLMVEDELRHLVFSRSGAFADRRMLRLTARYGPR